MKLNIETQYYKEVPIKQIERKDYHKSQARRFVLNNTNQNVWIPNCYLAQDGTLKPNINIDFIFIKSKRKFELAGILHLYKPFRKPNY